MIALRVGELTFGVRDPVAVLGGITATLIRRMVCPIDRREETKNHGGILRNFRKERNASVASTAEVNDERSWTNGKLEL